MKRQRTKRAVTKRRSGRPTKNKLHPPRTAEEFFAMPEKDQNLWNNVGQAVTTMRTERVSAPKAARRFDLDPRTLLQLARPALRKLRYGRWAERTHDHLLRVLVIPSTE